MYLRLRVYIREYKEKKEWLRMKPYFVFWYITFDGDPTSVDQAYHDHWGLKNKENYEKTMRGVNLNDYLLFFEKDFWKYQRNGEDYIVKKVKYKKRK